MIIYLKTRIYFQTIVSKNQVDAIKDYDLPHYAIFMCNMLAEKSLEVFKIIT